MSNEEAIKVMTEQLAYSDDVLPARLKEAYNIAINIIKNSRAESIDEELQSFAQWLWDSHYLVDEAFTIRLVEQYKEEQLKEQKE